jgi:glyceraldehyde 3-phosphate dehydrogenase
MRKIRIGINGLGRIGRTVFRQVLDRPEIEIVAVNDLGNNPSNLCYMLKYDSIHGTLHDRVELIDRASTEKDWTASELVVDDKPMKVFSEDRLENVPWNELGVDIVVEATGNGRNLRHAREVLGSSVQRVVFTNSPDEHVDFTFVFDVNDTEYDPDEHRVIAASICDVVGMAPIIARIDTQYGVSSGFVTTLHPWLGYQNLMDGKPSAVEFKDKPHIYDTSTYQVMGRSSVGTLIPKNTSAVSAIEKVLPSIKGKLNAMSYRVPTDVVTTGVVTLELKRPTTTEEVKQFLKNSVRAPYSGYTEEPLISIDYKHNECSSIIDGKWIEVLDGRLLRFVSWYDNEWGYSARVVDIIEHIAQRDTA